MKAQCSRRSFGAFYEHSKPLAAPIDVAAKFKRLRKVCLLFSR
jgi:hypothetical protein